MQAFVVVSLLYLPLSQFSQNPEAEFPIRVCPTAHEVIGAGVVVVGAGVVVVVVVGAGVVVVVGRIESHVSLAVAR